MFYFQRIWFSATFFVLLITVNACFSHKDTTEKPESKEPQATEIQHPESPSPASPRQWGLEGFLDNLNNASVDIRRGSVEILASYEDPDGTTKQVLQNHVPQESNASVLVSVFDTYTKLGGNPSDFHDNLVSRTQHTSWQQRQLGVALMSHLPPDESRDDILIELFQRETQAEVLDAIVATLGTLYKNQPTDLKHRMSQIQSKLKEQLIDPSPAIRQMAARSFAHLTLESDTRQVLMDHLEQESVVTVASEVFQTLLTTGSTYEDIQPILIHNLESIAFPDVQVCAAVLLTRFPKKHHSAIQIELKQVFQNTSDIRVLKTIMDTDRALPLPPMDFEAAILEKLSDEASSANRDAALQLLAGFPANTEIRNALQDHIGFEPDAKRIDASVNVYAQIFGVDTKIKRALTRRIKTIDDGMLLCALMTSFQKVEGNGRVFQNRFFKLLKNEEYQARRYDMVVELSKLKDSGLSVHNKSIRNQLVAQFGRETYAQMFEVIINTHSVFDGSHLDFLSKIKAKIKNKNAPTDHRLVALKQLWRYRDEDEATVRQPTRRFLKKRHAREPTPSVKDMMAQTYVQLGGNPTDL